MLIPSLLLLAFTIAISPASTACIRGDETAACAVGASDTASTAKPVTKDSVLLQVKHAELVKVMPHRDSCCGACSDHAFCSPQSGKCYDSKKQDYYESCGNGGLAPPPPPASANDGSCCSGCPGHAFCSPQSRSCYDTRHKPYYRNCKPKVADKIVWSDEFDDVNGDGTVNASRWKYNNGDVYNNELQAYTGRADNSYVEDGVLKLVAKCETYSRRRASFTSARLVTNGLGDWGPGHRVEVRAKLPAGKGSWPAIWMLPSNEAGVMGDGAYGAWPKSGEIDIMESVGCSRGKVYGTVHTEAYNHMKHTQKGRDYDCDYSQFHNYTIDWEESEIRWYVDGVYYHSFAPDNTDDSDKWPFNRRFYLILNIAVGGDWGGFCLHGGPSCSDSDEFGSDQVMEVDFVRIYKLVSAEKS